MYLSMYNVTVTVVFTKMIQLWCVIVQPAIATLKALIADNLSKEI